MASGKIYGTTMVENGKRVTPRDVKARRERNIDVALNGKILKLAEFQSQRVKWLSTTDAQRKARYEEIGIFRAVEDQESVITGILAELEEEANKEC